MTSPVPTVGRFRPIRVPKVAEQRLRSGLRVLAVRRPGVPTVQLRLWVPLPELTAPGAARRRLLAKSLLTGTTERSDLELSEALQDMGGSLGAGLDTDWVRISGSTLARRLPDFLEVVAEVLTAATFPSDRISTERARLAEEMVLAHSQPQVVAAEALARRLYGRHPYGLGLPTAEAVQRVGPATVRRLHQEALRPRGATLVLAGDVRPQAAVELAAAAFRRWRAPGRPQLVDPPPPPRIGPMVVVDRPGAVQTNIRLGGEALARSHPGYAALELANLVVGGYFSSRLVRNIREDKGYSYHVRSSLDHARASSQLTVVAEVATEVTGPALVELIYELGRMAQLPVGDEELEAARRYRLGTLAIATQTQAGLADQLAMLVAAGLDAGYLRDHPRALAHQGPEEVMAAARRFLAPVGLATVLVGDAERIIPAVEVLGPVRTV